MNSNVDYSSHSGTEISGPGNILETIKYANKRNKMKKKKKRNKRKHTVKDTENLNLQDIDEPDKEPSQEEKDSFDYLA